MNDPTPHPSPAPPPAPERRPARVRWLLSAALTAAVLAALAWGADLEASRDAVLGADRGRLLGALAVVVAVRFGGEPLRWRWALARLGCPLPLLEAVLLQGASMPLKYVTPAKAGVLVSVVYLQRRHGLDPGRGLSSVLIEKLHNLLFYLGLLVLLPLVGAAAALEWPLALGRGWVAAGAALALGAALAGWVALARLPWRGWLAHHPRAPEILRRLAGPIEQVLSAFVLLSPRQQLTFFAMTCAILGLEYVEFRLLFEAVGISVGLAPMMWGMTAAILFSNLPLTLGGVGTREAAVAVLFAPVASREALLAAMGLLFLWHFLLPALLGAPLLLPFFRRLAAAREGSPQPPRA